MAKYKDIAAYLEEQAKQILAQHYIFLLFTSFLLITLFSIKDKELLISDRQIILPILNTGIPPNLLFIFGPFILVIFYINFHIHLYRFIKDTSALLRDNKEDYFLPLTIFKSLFHQCNGFAGKLESAITKVSVFGLLVPTLSLFGYWGIKQHQWQLDIYLLISLMTGMLLERYWIWASYLQQTQQDSIQACEGWSLATYHLLVVLLTILCLFFFIPVSLRENCLFSPLFNTRVALCGLFFLGLHFVGNLTRLSNTFSGNTNNFILSISTRITIMVLILSGYFSIFNNFYTYNPNVGENPSEPFKFLLLDLSYETLSKKPELWENPFEGLKRINKPQIISINKEKENTNLNDLYFLNSYWVNLKKRHLEGANLSYTTLVKADLRSSTLDFSDLQGANLTQSDLRNASLLHAYLTDADLRMSDLREAKLNYANLNDTDLTNAQMEDAQVKSSYLINSIFKHAQLLRVNFQDSLLYNASFIGSCLKGANFENANLSNANLSNASLNNANLSNTDLRYTILNNANLSHANLSNVKLDSTDLRYTDLQAIKIYEPIRTDSHFTDEQLEFEARAFIKCETQQCRRMFPEVTAKFCKSKNMAGSKMQTILKAAIYKICPEKFENKEK